MAVVEGELFRRTQECQDLLKETVAKHLTESDGENESPEWFENRLADFNLWAAGLGASKLGRASLEHRLRDRPDVAEIIQGMLDELYESLFIFDRRDDVALEAPSSVPDSDLLERAQDEEVVASRSPSPVDLSGLSENVKDPNLLEECKKSVEMILDQLARLSVLIRKSGSRLRYQKADRMLNFHSLPEDLQAFREGLTEIVLIPQDSLEANLIKNLRRKVFQNKTRGSVLIVVRAWLVNPARLSPVQDRLIRANIKRRNRFTYAYIKATEGLDQHQKEPQVQVEQSPVVIEQQVSIDEVITTLPAPSKSVKSISASKQERKLLETKPHADETMTATDLGSKFTLKKIRASNTMSVDTRMSNTAATLDYPRPPRVESGRRTFKCPYCQHALPKEYIDRGARRWKAHVREDLEPYVCVFPDCRLGEGLFISSEEWIKHMKDRHTTREWVCPVCDPEEIFENVEDFHLHMYSAEDHMEETTESQLSILGDLSLHQMPLDFTTCPLCNYLERPNSADTPLQKHIAEHIHAFSLMSLPWNIGLEGSERSLAVTGFAGENTNSYASWDNDSDSSEAEEFKTISQLWIELLQDIKTATEFKDLEHDDATALGVERIFDSRPIFQELINRIDWVGKAVLSAPTTMHEDQVKETLIGSIIAVRRIDNLQKLGATAFQEEVYDFGDLKSTSAPATSAPSTSATTFSAQIEVEHEVLSALQDLLFSMSTDDTITLRETTEQSAELVSVESDVAAFSDQSDEPNRPVQRDQPYGLFKILVAIDFGNAYSSLAWTTTRTQPASQDISGRRRDRSRERDRHKRYHLDRPQSPIRRRYRTPSPPVYERGAPHVYDNPFAPQPAVRVDPVAAAYQAGKRVADAERLIIRERRRSPSPPPRPGRPVIIDNLGVRGRETRFPSPPAIVINTYGHTERDRYPSPPRRPVVIERPSSQRPRASEQRTGRRNAIIGGNDYMRDYGREYPELRERRVVVDEREDPRIIEREIVVDERYPQRLREREIEIDGRYSPRRNDERPYRDRRAVPGRYDDTYDDIRDEYEQADRYYSRSRRQTSMERINIIAPLRNPPHLQTSWPGSSAQESRVPTVLKYNDDGTCNWGFQVEKEEIHYEFFKLGPNPFNPVEDATVVRNEFDALPSENAKFVADYLKALYKHSENMLQTSLGESVVKSSLIIKEYIFTLPATWSDDSKRNLTACAERAGIDGALYIMSELEAAATSVVNDAPVFTFKDGDSFLLCDAGAITVDVACFTIRALEPVVRLREAAPASCGLCGSAFLDRNFASYLKAKFRDEPLWNEEYASQTLKLFESKTKRSFLGDKGFVLFELPVRGLPDNPETGVKNGRLTVSKADIRNIFEPVVAEILSLAKDKIDTARERVKTIAVVGGFGRSQYLRNRLKEMVGREVTVYHSMDSLTATVKGALLRRQTELSPPEPSFHRDYSARGW